MIINKITEGFVTQQWDTEKNQWVSQEFTAGGDCVYEDVTGNSHNVMTGESYSRLLLDHEGNEPYLPFDMSQPTAAQ